MGHRPKAAVAVSTVPGSGRREAPRTAAPTSTPVLAAASRVAVANTRSDRPVGPPPVVGTAGPWAGQYEATAKAAAPARRARMCDHIPAAGPAIALASPAQTGWKSHVKVTAPINKMSMNERPKR